jgi:hypothetical protein
MYACMYTHMYFYVCVCVRAAYVRHKSTIIYQL